MEEPRYDWERIEHSPQFFLAYYMAFILLAGYAKDFMASSVYEGLTVGYCLALTQFVMVFVLGIVYLRKSDRDYDSLAAKVACSSASGGRSSRYFRPK